MADRRTIEDVVLTALQQHGTDELYPDDEFDCCAEEVHTFLVDATADGPVPSADGSLAVIRTDPELAEKLRAWDRVMAEAAGMEAIRLTEEARAALGGVLHRAALLAAPAPADPERQLEED